MGNLQTCFTFGHVERKGVTYFNISMPYSSLLLRYPLTSWAIQDGTCSAKLIGMKAEDPSAKLTCDASAQLSLRCAAIFSAQERIGADHSKAAACEFGQLRTRDKSRSSRSSLMPINEMVENMTAKAYLNSLHSCPCCCRARWSFKFYLGEIKFSHR